MQLAEAIRFGAQRTGHCRDTLMQTNLTERRLETCVVGAIAYATGASITGSPGLAINRVIALYPEMEQVRVVCPTCGDEGTLFDIMVHLNDSHLDSTREAIADWVDTVLAPMTLEIPVKEIAHAAY